MTLVLAMLLDAALGEPAWLWSRLPHPAVLTGRLIDALDQRFNRGAARRWRGVAVMAGLGAGALLLGAALASFGPLAEVLVGGVLLAHRSLVDHLRAVADALMLSLAEGRVAVGRIVGRDTRYLDEAAVARAAIESGAENFSDGLVAPLFWFALFGLPGLLLYKVTNTADSMIGYRTPRHEDFGWAAARFDDLLNLVPARASAVLIAAVSGKLRQWPEIVRDARHHRSPNAGWPEAAMARGLGVALSGPRAYHGEMREFAWVNGTARRDAGERDIDRAVTLLWRAWALCLVLAALTAL